MPTKLVLQQRGASGLNTAAELPTLENGKVNIGLLPVVGEMGAAIIERGDNANGEYIRWADGTQVCRSTITLAGNWFETQTVWSANQYTPPAAFIDSYDVYVSYANAGSLYLSLTFHSGILQIWNTGRSSNDVHPGAAVRGTGGGSYNVTSLTIRVVAIGRWK